MTPPRRIVVAVMCAVGLTLVVGAATVEAQRAVRRAPVTQGRHAVPRPAVPARPVYGGRVYYPRPYYRPYYARPYYWGGFYGGFYAFPFHLSIGVGPGYGPSYGYPYQYPFPYPYPYPRYSPYPYGYWYDSISSVRIDVTPRLAEVYVDGYYAGAVDDFNGGSQLLRLNPGNHIVQVFLPGHRTLTQNLHLQSGKTFTVQAALEPLAPGDPEPVRPSARPIPTGPSRAWDRPSARDRPPARAEVTERSGVASP